MNGPTRITCICPYTDPSTWLSAASCGYGSGYEPGSMQEWDPDCPVHPGDPYYSRVQAIEAAEDHADQVAFDAWRERGL